MDCIEHQGAPTSKGYRRERVGGEQVLAHRAAYCRHHGLSLADIAGQVVRHTCDNRACVNPVHLLIGTHADNMQDKADRKRVHGERNPNVKLSDVEVAQIRARYVPKCRVNGGRALAREFGVTGCAVSYIINHKTRENL